MSDREIMIQGFMLVCLVVTLMGLVHIAKPPTDVERIGGWVIACEARGQLLGSIVEVAPGELRGVCRPVWGAR